MAGSNGTEVDAHGILLSRRCGRPGSGSSVSGGLTRYWVLCYKGCSYERENGLLMSEVRAVSRTDTPKTSLVSFHTPGEPVSIKTSYLVAEQLVIVLPTYAASNPGRFLTIRVGHAEAYVLPVDTPFSVTHGEVPEEAVSARENLRIAEKLTGTLNEDLSLFFTEAGDLLSWNR